MQLQSNKQMSYFDLPQQFRTLVQLQHLSPTEVRRYNDLLIAAKVAERQKTIKQSSTDETFWLISSKTIIATNVKITQCSIKSQRRQSAAIGNHSTCPQIELASTCWWASALIRSTIGHCWNRIWLQAKRAASCDWQQKAKMKGKVTWRIALSECHWAWRCFVAWLIGCSHLFTCFCSVVHLLKFNRIISKYDRDWAASMMPKSFVSWHRSVYGCTTLHASLVCLLYGLDDFKTTVSTNKLR